MEQSDKAHLREEFSAARRARGTAEIETARLAVRTAVLQRCAADGWRCVAGYVPLRTEPGSTELLDGLCELGVRVLVPVLLPDRDLDWAEWDGVAGAQTPPRPLGVDAITSADAVLAPALAVARDGVRLGRGGGSYDRALPRAATALRIALLFDGELVDRLPAEPWDVRMDEVVTPTGWHRLDGARDTG